MDRPFWFSPPETRDKSAVQESAAREEDEEEVSIVPPWSRVHPRSTFTDGA